MIKLLFGLLSWMMLPLAVILVAIDIAKTFVESKAIDILERDEK